MTDFLLLARGEDLRTARVLAVSADKRLVGRFLGALAEEDADAEGRDRSGDRERLRVVEGGEDG